MNNRYICKAKRKDNNEWIEGYLVKYNERYYIYYEYVPPCTYLYNSIYIRFFPLLFLVKKRRRRK